MKLVPLWRGGLLIVAALDAVAGGFISKA
jgi:hypothetical protein